MSVRGIAAEALAQREEEVAERKRTDAEREQAAYEARREHAFELLRKSPLPSWFPEQEWEWYGDQYSSVGYPAIFVPADRPAGTNPAYVGVPVFEVSTAGQVNGVTEQHSEGYPYWVGPRLRSLADVGAWIKATVDPLQEKLNPEGEGVVR